MFVPASPATGSREIMTRLTWTLSSAHPVIAIDPLSPVAPLAGVSTTPKGGFVVSPACVTV